MMKSKVIILFATLGLLGCKMGYKVSVEPMGVIVDDSFVATPELQSIDTSYMNRSVRPNDDFFEYCNGQWVQAHPIPPSESRWGSFNELDQNNKAKLIAILDGFRNAPNTPDAKLLGAYYASYINMERRDELGIKPIEQELKKIRDVRSKSEFPALLAQQHLIGVHSLFNFSVRQDMKQPKKHISYLSQSGIGLPNKEYYLNENKADVREKYKLHIQRMFMLIGYQAEQANQKATQIFNLELKLAQAMYSPAELRLPEKTYNKRSKNETERLFDAFDFDQYLVQVGSKSFDSLVVANPDFIKVVATLISRESLSDWKDYLEWRLIDDYAGTLGTEFVEANFDFYSRTLSGKTQLKPIKERVIEEITKKDFGEVLGKAFVEKYFSIEAQEKVNAMVDDLLAVFKARIEQLEWMTPETKQEALFKLSSIGRKLGFPSKWEDFSGLKFDSLNYVDNLKQEIKFSHKRNMEDLNNQVDPTKWEMPAHMVNAYYHPLLNEIAFPAGIMQPPFFDANAEDALNYGRIGTVIGHEFTHGFDDNGSKFAADGSYRNWWSDADRKLFEEKTGILGETFSSFCPITDNCVNAQLTMGENIADLGGMTLAFYAYKRTDEYKKGTLLYGFTPSQRFFISYGQLWKVNYTEAELKRRIATDPHSPGMYRVNGPLMNCPEFFDAFGIKEGDKMRNPANKIARIW
jgi:putative endopeptidase